MKKIIIGSVLTILYVSTAQAALITRTYSYSSGNTITANENNTNENTLYNEFNGNVESANIKDGTIVNADIADTTIAVGKFAATVQSTFTFVNNLLRYQRPNLIWNSATLVDVDTNTGTNNQTCIYFVDEVRCVTENLASTNKYRRFDLTATANFTSGTEDSGLYTGLTQGTTTTWAIYAVKSQINSANFVLVGSSLAPITANYSLLNTQLNTYGWVFLGYIFNGNNAGTSGGNQIVKFHQSGPYMAFDGSYPTAYTGFNFASWGGVAFAYTAGATSLTWSYATGMTAGTLPATVKAVQFDWYVLAAGAGAIHLARSDGGGYIARSSGASLEQFGKIWNDANEGFQITTSAGGSTKFLIGMSGYFDSALTSNYQQLY